jgi:predicted nucleotidyltransferase
MTLTPGRRIGACAGVARRRHGLARDAAALSHNRRMEPDVRRRLASFFAAHPGDAIAAYLFGSLARGDDRADSDVDVAVLFAVAPPPALSAPPFTLTGDLERALERPVDLVVLNTASADLVHRILRDGQIVLDRDRARRLRFEVAKRNEYFDLEPVRRLYRRQSRSVEPHAMR